MRSLLVLATGLALLLCVPPVQANHWYCAQKTEYLYLGTTPPTAFYLYSDCNQPDSQYHATNEGTTLRCEFVPVARVAGQQVPGTGQTYCVETPTFDTLLFTTSNSDYMGIEVTAAGVTQGYAFDTAQHTCLVWDTLLRTAGHGYCVT